MSSVSFTSIILVITLFGLIMSTNAQAQDASQSNVSDGSENKNSANIDAPSIPVHNDTSRDNEGINHDSEPLANNGRGTQEANSQNIAAETNSIHGIPTEDFQRIILEQHNKFRRQMCSNDLQNDNELHEKAHEIAHKKANENTTILSNDFNENVYELDTGDPVKITGDMIVQAWYDEHKGYDPKNEGSATHYSQLAWKNTKKLGVGHAYSGQKLVVVALYKPPGNIRGQFAANVGCGLNNHAQQQQNQANR